MAEAENIDSLEYEPTWIVAAVSFVIVLISLSLERALHFLGKTLKKNHHDALFDCLQKLKFELMVMGFISLLLTVFQGAISRICIPEDLTKIMLPCQNHSESEGGSETKSNRRQLLSEAENHCDKGKGPLLSLEALHQLHVFIFVLAVVYVIFCTTTMILGSMKLRRWRYWEQSIMRPAQEADRSGITQMQAHTELIKFEQRRAFGDCTWMASFFKQFHGSISKSDYYSLRLGFITVTHLILRNYVYVDFGSDKENSYHKAHCPSHPTFDFHKYMMRTLGYDFKRVISIRWYLWAFVIIFLLVNIKGWHSYFWLSFLPLILLVALGAKLEHIITCMAKQVAVKNSANNNSNSEQVQAVKPSDHLFWFGRPGIVLYLLQFILFQNSFEIAFLFWVLCTYGIHSCILDKLAFAIPRLVIGVMVQVLCSYSILPLYTIVTPMASKFKQTIFNDQISRILQDWRIQGVAALH